MTRLQIYPAENFEQSPCTDPTKMDDWYIPDNITADVIAEYALITNVPYGIDADALKARRDGARQACYYDCPRVARLLCLDEGLRPQNSAYGIWGGYTEGQRRAVIKATEERKVVRRKLAKAMIAAETREAAQPAV